MREIWTNIFFVAFLLSFVFLVWGIIKPSGLPGSLQKIISGRKKALQVFGILTVASLISFGIAAPDQSRANIDIQNAAATKKAIRSASQAKTQKKDTIEVKQVAEAKPVAFTTVTQDDNSLPKGQTKVVQQGSDGVETLTYSVTYTNGKESNRTLQSQAVTTQPTPKIIANGTYVAPAPAPAKPTCGSGYYLNSDNLCVHSPSADPSGATARCVDGTYSYSLHHSGTCSHHGGVAEWL